MALIILNINSVLRDFEKTFYTEPLMVILNILFLALALKLNLKDKKYRIFVLYGVAALLQDIIAMGISLTNYTPYELVKNDEKLVDASIIAFIQIEFIVFYRFFYRQFDGKLMQFKTRLYSYLFISLSLPCSLYFILFTTDKSIHAFLGYLSVTTSVLQLIPAFYYFYTLFKDPPVKNLLRESSFWIVTGIAFLHGLNIPLFLMDNYIMYQFHPFWLNMYTINFISYCFLFVLFIIGLLCDKAGISQVSTKNAAATLNKIF